nr:hypothetical protein [Petrachloros mirabilis]
MLEINVHQPQTGNFADGEARPLPVAKVLGIEVYSYANAVENF